VREINLGGPKACSKLQRRTSDTDIVSGTPNSAFENVNVLLVEGKMPPENSIRTYFPFLDNQVNQRVVLYFLQKMGLSHVDTACDGSSAIEKATKNQYHVIFMDILVIN